MKLLYASERPPYPFFLGGAARSAHYLMTILEEELGVECLAVGSKDFADSHWSCPDPADYAALGISEVAHAAGTTSIQCGYTVRVYEDFRNSLVRTIDEYAPDIVWTQLDGVEDIARIVHDKDVKVLVYLRDAEDAPATLTSLVAAGCCIVCNSHFMARRVKQITGKDARVIHPSLESTFGVSGDPQGFITMINPHRVKGIDTFLEIARRMPTENFLIVESWSLDVPALKTLQDTIADLDNVRFLHRVPDVGEIYRQTKLLLVPSVWEEAFGRVVIEAQSCRIPVIASQRGGLPEAVGDGGVCVDDYLNAEAWVTAAQRVLRDAGTYQALSQRAHDHATGDEFSTQFAARRFLEICTDSSCFGVSDWLGVRTWLNRMRRIIRGHNS